MAIKILIAVQNGKVAYQLQEENITFTEAALANHQLDKAKQQIMDFDFQPDSEIKQNDDDDEELL